MNQKNLLVLKAEILNAGRSWQREHVMYAFVLFIDHEQEPIKMNSVSLFFSSKAGS